MKSLPIFMLMFGLWGSPVLAQTQRISAQAAQHQVPTIALKVNQGVNLTLPDGVVAYKGWLDDGSLIQLDGDRPFEQGASILHLLAHQAGKTQLSLVTRDANQVESLYVFKLVAGSQGNSIVNVTAHPVNPNILAIDSNANQLQRGVDLAIERRLLVENSELHLAIQGAIAQVAQGMSMEQAAATSQLNPRTMAQLFQMGQFAAPSPNPTRQEPLLVRAETSDQGEIKAQRLPSPQSSPITLAVNTVQGSGESNPSVEVLDRYQLANAIARGLTTHPDTPYRSPLYLRYQTMIRSLRQGSTPTQAVKQSKLQLTHVKSVLANAGVSPEVAGL